MRQQFVSKYLARLGLAILLLTHFAPGQGLAIEPLVPLAQPGPWSSVNAIIGYGPRIWFTNSKVFSNHNAADIYSYDPKTGALRYERALFSQGAGQPLVAQHLLYWPFEDPRFAADRAEYAVTNGTDWAWRVIPEGNAYHLHAMAALNGKLYAATSAGRGGLRVSAGNAATWRVLYDHPKRKGQLSRITSLATFQGRLYAGLTQWRRLGQRMLTVTEEGTVPAAGWPDTHTARGLTAYRGNLFAILQDNAGRGLWRSDGGLAKQVAKGPSGHPLRALAAGEDTLWAITAGDGKGALWQSKDGRQWTKSQDFPDAEPVAWAMAQLGQGDAESLAALMARLNRPGDPDWLAGDIVGALTVLTGQRFGHDYGAWRSWWVQQRAK